MTVAAFLGWVGTGLVLGAYAAVTRTKRAGAGFHLANLVGALCLIVAAWSVGLWPVVALNLAWAVIALAGLSSSAT